MTRKNRKQCHIQTKKQNYTYEDNHSDERSKRKHVISPRLQNGGLAPQPRTKRSWKEKVILLREENTILTEKNTILIEKNRQYEDKLSKLQQISRKYTFPSVELGASEHVQIGNHNILQVVHNFDPACLKEHLDKYDKYENKIKSMEDQIQDLSSRIQFLQDNIESLSAYTDDVKP